MEQTVTTLFLDIGGVLLSNGWGHDFRERAADHFNLDKSEMEVRHKFFFVTYEEGHITLEEYLKRVVFYKKRNFSSGEFRDFMFAQTTPYPEMIDLIAELKSRYRLQVVAVSNEARELNEFRIETFHLRKLIDFFISSCYVHVRKPDTSIFRLALDIARVQPLDVLYIDDVQIFTSVASDLGIRSIWHVDMESTSDQLKAIGFEIK